MGSDRYSASAGRLETTRLALVEIAEILEEFKGAVLVGGIVPYLLIPQDEEPHEGTVDIDVVVDPDRLRTEGELTLGDILMRRGFDQGTKKPFRWTKHYEHAGERHEILLEILAGGNPPSSGSRAIAREDVYASVIQGMEVALESPVEVDVNHLRLRVASIPAFFAMKSVALERRDANKRGKDAADIIYCLRNHVGGVEAVAQAMKAQRSNRLVEEGIERLSIQFADVNSLGPTSYALLVDDLYEQDLRRQEAYTRVQDLLECFW